MATTTIMKAPVRNADHRVRVLVVKRAARKPVSQALAITMGMPTHATNSETCENAKMEPVHEVHRITGEKSKDRKIERKVEPIEPAQTAARNNSPEIGEGLRKAD